MPKKKKKPEAVNVPRKIRFYWEDPSMDDFIDKSSSPLMGKYHIKSEAARKHPRNSED